MGSCVGAQSTQTKNTGIATMPTACVCVWCRCPCWLIACSFVVQLSQIPPFSPSTPLPSLSFFLFSFILSLPRSASPKTHCLLATKAFSSKNKRQSHDRQDKIWFNYRNLPKEFRVWAQIQRASVWGCDLSQAAWPAETSRCSASSAVTLCCNTKDTVARLLSTGGAGFHQHPDHPARA